MTDLLDRLESAAAQLSLTGQSAVERRDRSLGEISGLYFDEIHPDSAAALKSWMARLNSSMGRASSQPDNESLANDVLELINEMIHEITNMELDQIVQDLDDHRGELPRNAIQAARRHRDQIIPRLIGAIQQATELARAGEEVDGNAAFFSLFLLGEFRDREALPAILEAISLPGELPEELFGDAITEYLAPILAALLNGETGSLDRLIENPNVNEYVRWEAMQTWLHYVRDGKVTAAEAVDNLRRHLRSALNRDDRPAISPLVVELTTLGGAAAAREEIETALQRGAVDHGLISRKSIQQAMDHPEEKWQDRLAWLAPTGIDDTLATLERWACFQDDVSLDDDEDYSGQDGFDSGSDLDEDLPEATDLSDRLSNEPARRTGRNDPCPCGSGKKYKKCCMRRAIDRAS